MEVQCSIAKMKPDKQTVTTSAYVFGYFLSALLLKYILYDNGFELSNILLVAGLIYTRFYLFEKESTRLQEGACLILFVLFDKNLLDIGNVFLLLGVACIREQLPDDIIKKEIASFVCGLIYLLMGWFSVGKVLVIYFLLMFYFFTIGIFITIFVFSTIIEGLFDQLAKKLRGETSETNKKSDDVTTSEQKEHS